MQQSSSSHASPSPQANGGFTGYEPPPSPGQVSPEEAPLLKEEPRLQYGTQRRMNKKGLMFLGAIGLTGTALLAWGLSSFSLFGPSKATRAPKSETIELPQETFDTRPPPVPAQPASIPASAPPLPMQMDLPQQKPAQPIPVTPRGPSAMDLLAEQRSKGGAVVEGSGSGEGLPAMLGGAGNGKAAGGPAGQGALGAPASLVAKGSVSRIQSPDTLLPRGTYIRCVLETRIISDLPGFTSCVVTEPVYSFNGKRLLVAKGSKISGQYRHEGLESGRVAVIWERILTPDGLDVSLASPGVDGLGGSGHPGNVDRHWGTRITSALLISLIGDAIQIGTATHMPAAAKSQNTTTTVENGSVSYQSSPYQTQTAQAMQRIAQNALQEAVGRPATITINQGEMVTIYSSRDIDFASVLEP